MSVSIYWGTAAMLLPFYVRANNFNDIRISKNYALIFLTTIGCMLFGVGKLKIRAIAVVAAFAFFIHSNFYRPASMEQTVTFLGGCLLISHLLSHRLNEKVIKVCLAITCILTSAVFILNNMGFNPFNPSIPMKYPVGPLGQQTLSGALVAITITSLIQPNFWMFIPAAAMGLWISGSSMSYLAAGVNISLFTAMNKTIALKLKVSIITLLGIIGSMGLFSKDLLNDHSRFYSWSIAIKKMSNFSLMDQLFGRGLGDFWHSFGVEIPGQMIRYAHNEVIESLWAFGIVGTMIIAIIVYLPFKNFKSTYALAGFASVLVNSLGNFTFHIAPLALIGVIFYSLALKGERHGYDCNSSL